MVSKDTELVKLIQEDNVDEARKILKRYVRSIGWHKTLTILQAALDEGCGQSWFARNLFLLKLLESEELIGYDGDVEKVLEDVKRTRDYDKARLDTIRRLVDLVKEQIANSGSTLFFDLDRMENQMTSVLIADISKARLQEFLPLASRLIHEQELTKRINESDITDLVKTTYGYELLRQIRNSPDYLYDNIVSILSDLKPVAGKDAILNLDQGDLDIDDSHLRHHESSDPQKLSPHLSKRLENFIDSVARNLWLYDKESKLRSLFEEGCVDPIILFEKAVRVRKEGKVHSTVKGGRVYNICEISLEDLGIVIHYDFHSLYNMIIKIAKNRSASSLLRVAVHGLYFPDDGKITHKEIIDELELSEPEGFVEVLEEYLKGVEVEYSDGSYFFANTSNDAFETALSIIIKYNPQIVSELYNLLDKVMCSNWEDGLGSYLCDTLVRIEGSDAVEPLMKHIWFNSSTTVFEVGDVRVVDALRRLGPDLSEKLAVYIGKDASGYITWPIIDLLLEFGIKGKIAIVNQIAENFDQWYIDYGDWDSQYNATAELFEKSFDESISTWPIALLRIAHQLVHSDQTDLQVVSDWIGEMDVEIPTRVLMKAIKGNDHVLKSGACIYLAYRPRNSKTIIDALENLAETHTETHATIALARIAKKKHLQQFLDSIHPMLSHKLDAIHPILDAFQKFGRYGVRLLKNGCKSRKESVRNESLLILGLLASRAKMTQLLISEGLEWLVTILSHDDINEEILECSPLSVVSSELLDLLSYAKAVKEINLKGKQSRTSIETIRKRKEAKERRPKSKDPSYYSYYV